MSKRKTDQAKLEASKAAAGDRLETSRQVHDVLDEAETIEELKPVIEVILLKVFDKNGA